MLVFAGLELKLLAPSPVGQTRMSDVIGEDLGKICAPSPSLRGQAAVVTGGAGFLGSWMCDVLVKSGVRVTCVDNLSTQGSTSHITHLLGNRRFKFLKQDVTNWSAAEDYDLIIHAASTPSPEQYLSNPVETMLTNSVGFHKILDYASRHDSVVLYTSTSEVYGKRPPIPTPETYEGLVSTNGPRACYSESKRYGEAAALAYFRRYGVDVRILRLFNSYGPRLDGSSGYSRVVTRFVQQALRGEPLNVHGDGLQTRTFCYVSDTVSAIVKALAATSAKGEILNIGGTKEVRIIDVARMVLHLTGSRSSIVHGDRREDDPRRRRPDISKARRLLDWSPKVDFTCGMTRTIKWFERTMDQL